MKKKLVIAFITTLTIAGVLTGCEKPESGSSTNTETVVNSVETTEKETQNETTENGVQNETTENDVQNETTENDVQNESTEDNTPDVVQEVEADELCAKAVELSKQPGYDKTEYFNLLKEAYEKGSFYSYNPLARCYVFGIGTEPDIDKAFALIDEAIEKENFEVYGTLSDLYSGRASKDVERDDEKHAYYLILYFNNVPEERISYSYYNALAVVYAEGKFLAQDIPLAYDCLDTAIAHGVNNNNFYTNAINICLVNDNENEERAKYYAEKAIEENVTFPVTYLAYYYHNHERWEEALKYYEIVINNNDVALTPDYDICNNAGLCAFKLKEYEKARMYFQMSVDNNEKSAEKALGNLDKVTEMGY